MEFSKSDFLLAKEIQRSFCICDLSLRNCHVCHKHIPKGPIIENKVCSNNCTPKLNMVCVGMFTWMVRSVNIFRKEKMPS